MEHREKSTGILITFEGIDFSGKSVQASLLYEKLKAKGVTALFLREPGGTEISENIRNVLLDNKYNNMRAATEVLLYSAARAQMVAEKVLPHLKSRGVVICDRFYDSTTAYQGYGRQIDLDFIERLNEFVTQGIKPDVTFLIDLDPDEALKRKHKNGKSLDRLEQEDFEFHHRVRQGYLKIAQAEPNRFRIINGSRSIESIQEEIFVQTISILKL